MTGPRVDAQAAYAALVDDDGRPRRTPDVTLRCPRRGHWLARVWRVGDGWLVATRRQPAQWLTEADLRPRRFGPFFGPTPTGGTYCPCGRQAAWSTADLVAAHGNITEDELRHVG